MITRAASYSEAKGTCKSTVPEKQGPLPSRTSPSDSLVPTLSPHARPHLASPKGKAPPPFAGGLDQAFNFVIRRSGESSCRSPRPPFPCRHNSMQPTPHSAHRTPGYPFSIFPGGRHRRSGQGKARQGKRKDKAREDKKRELPHHTDNIGRRDRATGLQVRAVGLRRTHPAADLSRAAK